MDTSRESVARACGDNVCWLVTSFEYTAAGLKTSISGRDGKATITGSPRRLSITGGGGSKIGKFMKQKKTPNQLLASNLT